MEPANRFEAFGLVFREASTEDRRSVVLRLTADGAARLEVLTLVHRNELKQLSRDIVALLSNIDIE